MSRKIIVITAMLITISTFFIPSDNKASFVFSHSRNQPVVIIDPGHGGMDGGAVGTQGIEEKRLNLEISHKLRDLLTFCGVETAMTREEDTSIHEESARSVREKKVSDIKNRVAMIEKHDNARLISVHLNHFSQASCHGAQVFYSDNPQSKSLAEEVQERFKTGIDAQNRRVAMKADRSIYLLNNVTCPAILVECGFLSNPIEEKNLENPDYQKKIAMCIASGYIAVSDNL